MGRRLARQIQQEYEALAPVYDRRWRRYLDASLDATFARLPPTAGIHSILDIGCGSGELLRRLHLQSPHLKLTGADASLSMLIIAHRKLNGTAQLCNAAAEALPFSANSFDLVVSTSVLHYWPDPAQVLAETRRVLTPAGRLVLTDWCGDYLSCRLIAAGLRLARRPLAQLYRSTECRRLLQQNGFRVERLERYKISRSWGLMTAVAV